MATNTSNFNLKKPAYTDTADVKDFNDNMDKVDGSLNGLADAIAIVANNNTHAAITAGQYVYVHGHGVLAEGLYKANSNIAANATLTSSNLTADGSGGLNALNSNITGSFTTESGITINTIKVKKNINIVSVELNGITGLDNQGDKIGTLEAGFRPSRDIYCILIGRLGAFDTGTFHFYLATINSGGEIKAFGADMQNNSALYLSVMFMID